MGLLWAALGFSLGVYWGALWAVPWAAAVLLSIAVTGGYLLARSAGLRTGAVALLLIGVLLGTMRGGPEVLVVEGDLARHHGGEVELEGTVDGLPEIVGSRVRFTLAAERSRLRSDAWESASGSTVVWADSAIRPLAGRSHPFLSHGDRLLVAGRVDAPEVIGTFDYPEHLAARGIGSVMSPAKVSDITPARGFDPMRAVHSMRSELADAIERHLPEPQAAVTKALVLGMRGGITPELNDRFRASGLSHLLAVSGLHVSVFLGLVLVASARAVGRRRGLYLLPPLILLWVYILLTGAPPSAVRAGIMGTAFLLALASGRAAVPLNALGLAALAVLALGPESLWDSSFQLSFAAMAGVLLLGSPLATRAMALWPESPTAGSRWRPASQRAGRWLLAAVAVSSGAVAGSLPLVAFNFGQVPMLSIPATLVAMPLVPPLLVTGVLTAVLGSIVHALGTAVGLVPSAFAGLLVGEAEALGGLGWAAVDTDFVTTEWVWAAYVLLAGVVATMHRHRWLPAVLEFRRALWNGPAGRAPTLAVVAGLAIIAAARWTAYVVDDSDSLFHVYFLDVGQGDATLIVTPNGGTTLVDGGPDQRLTLQAIDSLLPAGRTELDVAILTHPHADHLSGILELARRGRMRRIVVPPLIDTTDRVWWDELHTLDLAVDVGGEGMELRFEDGTVLEVLHPPDPPLRGTLSDVNNNGLVVRATYGSASVLFTGDIDANAERLLLSFHEELEAHVLQVGHHGSDTSGDPSFLGEVAPSVAVISVGIDNRFGHPAAEAVDRLVREVGVDWLFQTATHGTVELVSDGEGWWVETERGG